MPPVPGHRVAIEQQRIGGISQRRGVGQVVGDRVYQQLRDQPGPTAIAAQQRDRRGRLPPALSPPAARGDRRRARACVATRVAATRGHRAPQETSPPAPGGSRPTPRSRRQLRSAAGTGCRGCRGCRGPPAAVQPHHDRSSAARKAGTPAPGSRRPGRGSSSIHREQRIRRHHSDRAVHLGAPAPKSCPDRDPGRRP